MRNNIGKNSNNNKVVNVSIIKKTITTTIMATTLSIKTIEKMKTLTPQ